MTFHRHIKDYVGIIRIMIFIDEGYLKNIGKLYQGKEFIINYPFLLSFLAKNSCPPLLYPYIIRTYYYTGNFKDYPTNPKFITKYQEIQNKIKKLKEENHFEIKIGSLIEENNSIKQKGVDTLIAIDMLSKAY